MQFDMRWEHREQLIREEEREEGQRIKLINQIQRKAKRGKTLAEIADELEETEEAIRPILKAIEEKGVDCPLEEMYEYLNGKLHS